MSRRLTANHRNTLVASAILFVGLMQMAGDLLQIPALKGLGAATMISPAPKVFTAQRGFETYSTKFYVEYTDKLGERRQLEVTPELYMHVKGPYWRRNVYGAVLSYGPVLASDPVGKPMFDAVSQYALGGDAPLLREIGGEPDPVTPISITFVPPSAVTMGNWPRKLDIKR